MLIMALLLIGCSKKEPKIKDNIIKSKQKIKAAPFWVNNPKNKNNPFRAVGRALKSPGGILIQKVEALSSTRDKIEEIITKKAEELVKNFYNKTHIFEKKDINRIKTRVAKQASVKLLNTTKEKQIWINPVNADLYILVELDKNRVVDRLKKEMVSVLKSNIKWWKKFKEKKYYSKLKVF